MKKTIITATLSAVLMACTGNGSDADAARMLQDARTALGHKRYAAARDTILAMRRRHPEAIEARRRAILLLDSVELSAAADSMRGATGAEWERLDVKRQFFERKLQEDKKKDAR